MDTKGKNARRWLLWIVLLAASAGASAQQDQQQMQQQQQLLQQQQQALQQQVQQLQQLQQQQQADDAGASSGFSAAYLDCRKRANGGYEQLRCIEREQRLQQQRLDRAYDTLRYRLGGRDRARLMDAQYAWQQSDAQAKDLDQALGGRGQAATVQSAEAALQRINARATELEKYAGPNR